MSTFEAPSIEEVSRLFPAYDIYYLIACGGMGAVYYANQLSLDRIVAIKILPREFADDVNFRDSFESEAKAMARLNHPNLIGIYDFGKVEDMFFIVMEYVDGKSLYHLSHGCPVERKDAIRIIVGVCDGLAHAHEYGILHRDIKPSNILMDQDMNPKVGDFGLAQAMGKAIADGEQIFGTPGYTAPEVIQPPHQFDQRADVYSVAVMLQELLTGRSPNPEHVLDPELAMSNPRISGVIRAGIEPDPRKRINNVTEFARALKQVETPKKRATLSTQKSAVGGPSLTRPIGALGGRPASALGSKPVGALGNLPKTGSTVQRAVVSTGGESSGMIWLLVLVVIVAVGVGVIISKKAKEQKIEPPVSKNPKEGIPETVAKPPEIPKSSPISKIPVDADSAIKSARSAASGRLNPDYESLKRDMKVSAEKLKGDLIGIVPSLQDVIDSNFSNWQSNGHRIPGALPNELSRNSGVGAVHKSAVDQQRAAAEKLEERIKLQAGLYIMELENLIASMENSSKGAAVSQLEAEIERVRNRPEYFRSLMPK